MIIWRATTSNDKTFSEDTIEEFVTSEFKMTPWLLLEKYCQDNNVTVKSIVLWDTDTHHRLFSPGAYLCTSEISSIEFLRRYVTNGIGPSNSTKEFSGFIITKSGVSMGVWIDSETKEVHTTIEP